MKTVKIMLGAASMLLATSSVNAKVITDSIETNYRRSSICSFLVSRTDQKLHDKIEEEFLEIPTPSQYNEHDLSVRILNVSSKGKYADDIDSWLNKNHIAGRVVSRWFDRNILTGECGMNLIYQRGLYNATEFDKELASRSPRGINMLQDAGEELIGNTFVLVHEAHYIDNAQRSKNVAAGLRVAGLFAGAFLGGSLGQSVSDLGDNLGSMAETFKGFRVKIHTRLYQLVWDDEAAGTFYQSMWNNKEGFLANRDKLKLKYIGEVSSSGSKNSFMGISEEHPEIMIRKACQRAIDDNVRDLQHNFEAFRVKSPIIAVNGNEVMVPIGMKEGITTDSEYEVLEAEEREGRTVYRRIGTIAPIENRIMDNRFMASEEGAAGSDLKATAFKVKSGKTPMPGHLVRQIK
ncbi:MAG: hypothetical protein NC301_04375 [Bacteroides sp.]|nr:hypothetical protein [Bacteroides sp.]MCM1379693.1 hypothetical protein [Bacteroides sp.]MCM1446048.1 hypothetical protein [Prevotella sp.]